MKTNTDILFITSDFVFEVVKVSILFWLVHPALLIQQKRERALTISRSSRETRKYTSIKTSEKEKLRRHNRRKYCNRCRISVATSLNSLICFNILYPLQYKILCGAKQTSRNSTHVIIVTCKTSEILHVFSFEWESLAECLKHFRGLMVSVQFYWMNTKKVFNKFGVQNCLVIRSALGCYTKCRLISNKILRQREAKNRYTHNGWGHENVPEYENSHTKIRVKLNISIRTTYSQSSKRGSIDFLKMKNPCFYVLNTTVLKPVLNQI